MHKDTQEALEQLEQALLAEEPQKDESEWQMEDFLGVDDQDDETRTYANYANNYGNDPAPEDPLLGNWIIVVLLIVMLAVGFLCWRWMTL